MSKFLIKFLKRDSRDMVPLREQILKREQTLKIKLRQEEFHRLLPQLLNCLRLRLLQARHVKASVRCLNTFKSSIRREKSKYSKRPRKRRQLSAPLALAKWTSRSAKICLKNLRQPKPKLRMNSISFLFQ